MDAKSNEIKQYPKPADQSHDDFRNDFTAFSKTLLRRDIDRFRVVANHDRFAISLVFDETSEWPHRTKKDYEVTIIPAPELSEYVVNPDVSRNIMRAFDKCIRKNSNDVLLIVISNRGRRGSRCATVPVSV
jgi:hypothetical protein